MELWMVIRGASSGATPSAGLVEEGRLRWKEKGRGSFACARAKRCQLLLSYAFDSADPKGAGKDKSRTVPRRLFTSSSSPSREVSAGKLSAGPRSVPSAAFLN